jgi:hypothetical protein
VTNKSLVKVTEHVSGFILEILPRQTAQNSSLRGKGPTGAERTHDIPQLLKQQNWLKHLCTLSTVTSCLSPAKDSPNLQMQSRSLKPLVQNKRKEQKDTPGTAGTPPQTTSQVQSVPQSVRRLPCDEWA